MIFSYSAILDFPKWIWRLYTFLFPYLTEVGLVYTASLTLSQAWWNSRGATVSLNSLQSFRPPTSCYTSMITKQLWDIKNSHHHPHPNLCAHIHTSLGPLDLNYLAKMEKCLLWRQNKQHFQISRITFLLSVSCKRNRILEFVTSVIRPHHLLPGLLEQLPYFQHILHTISSVLWKSYHVTSLFKSFWWLRIDTE